VEKPLRGKVQKRTFPLRLEIPPRARDSHFPTPAPAGLWLHMKWRDNPPQSYILKWLDADCLLRATYMFARATPTYLPRFMQPQLLAIRCLMRYEDWIFRESPARLCGHRELRQSVGVSSVPSSATLDRFLRPIDCPAIDWLVRQSPDGREAGGQGIRVSAAATASAGGTAPRSLVRRGHRHAPRIDAVEILVELDCPGRFLSAATPVADCASLYTE
jgi:hypothetical protein